MSATRTRWKTYALGALSIAALLSSTACGSDGGNGKAGSSAAPTAASATPSATAPPTSEPRLPLPAVTRSPIATPSRSSAGGEDGAEVPPGSGDGGQNATVACTGTDVSLTARFYEQDGDRHLLLTATNVGDQACTLYRYPLVRLGDGGQDPVLPLESDWRAVATIGPNEKAYSGVRLFRAGGEKTKTVRSLTVAFRDRENEAEAGRPVNIPLTTPDVLNVGAMPGVIFWNNDVRVVEKYLLAT
ncbi:hypothetical protein SAVIM338S_00393 [Streptomyces avidinii]